MKVFLHIVLSLLFIRCATISLHILVITWSVLCRKYHWALAKQSIASCILPLQVEVSDIEQLVVTGKQMKACPYYGTRYAIPSAQVDRCNAFQNVSLVTELLNDHCTYHLVSLASPQSLKVLGLLPIFQGWRVLEKKQSPQMCSVHYRNTVLSKCLFVSVL